MIRTLIALGLGLALILPAQASRLPWESDPSTAWPAGGGSGLLEIRGDYLPDFGVEVLVDGEFRRERLSTPVAVESGPLWIYAPLRHFSGLVGGNLQIRTPFSLIGPRQTVALEMLSFRPAEYGELPALHGFDEDNNLLVIINNIHARAFWDQGVAELHNADVRVSSILAEMLGVPLLQDMLIGQIWLDLELVQSAIPGQPEHFQYPESLAQFCEGRPLWPQDGHEVDVTLTNIPDVAGQGFQPGSGFLKIAPSALLRNDSNGDVPWFRQFQNVAPGFYPGVPRDQHPFLVWNVYRLLDGRIEQLAASGVKHAFLTINSGCAQTNCDGFIPQAYRGHVLWPNCLDLYSAGNNDMPAYQGPRDEVSASLGLWNSCHSFFDPNCTGSQTQDSGQWLNRLLIAPAELNLGTAGARYFIDAWYVVQYDINIWNTMGFRSITPTQQSGGGYTFAPLGPFTQGPPLKEWVPEGVAAEDRGHVVVTVPSLTPDNPYPYNMPQGHLRVLVKVDDLGNGQWRYRYAVMNYDFDRGLDAFAIPLPANAALEETWMGGPPDVLEAAWPATRLADRVVFEAPEGEVLPWFTLYNFELVTDQAPTRSGEVRLVPVDGPEAAWMQPALPAPGRFSPAGLLFQDRFED